MLSLVARMIVEPSEVDKKHLFRIEISRPDGSREPMCNDSPLNTKRNDNDPEDKSGAGLIVKMGLVLPHPGKYRLHLIVNNKELKEIPLWLKYSPATEKEQ
jgi:hypothetical protein